jgi:hypothetical protein
MAFLDAVRPTFRAVAVTVVPEAAALDAAAWRDVEDIVDRAIALRPARLQRQLGVFVRLIEWLPLVSRGRRFTALDARGRAAFLAGLERSRLLLVRRGFWGLRTLVLMGYYARPAAAGAIGYRAAARGWEARA